MSAELAAPARFPCPNCGATDEWRVEYDQAVHQGVYVYADPASPGGFDIADYRGDEDSYDDGSSENENLKCWACEHVIPLTRVIRLPIAPDFAPGAPRLAEFQGLAAAVGYTADPPDDPDTGLAEDVPGDALVGYKDALEDSAFALAGAWDDLARNLSEQLRTAEEALRGASWERAQTQTAANELEATHAALQGAVDAWRIALGYMGVEDRLAAIRRG